VVFREEDERLISLELRRFNRYRIDTPENYQALIRWLYVAPSIIAPTIGQKPDLPPEPHTNTLLQSIPSMSESPHINGSKEEIYSALLQQIEAVISGTDDLIANLANVAAILKQPPTCRSSIRDVS